MTARLIRLMSAIICYGFSLALVVAAAVWYAGGGRVYGVQTGSMVPTFQPGDAVLVRQKPAAAVRPGDVVSYRRPDGIIVSHRLIRRVGSDKLLTKGDHNHLADSVISDSQVIGQVVAVAPHLGSTSQFVRSPLGLAGIYGLLGLLTALELRRYYRVRRVIYQLQHR